MILWGHSYSEQYAGWVSIAVINTTIKNNLGRKGFILLALKSNKQPIAEGSQGRNMDAGTEGEAVEEYRLHLHGLLSLFVSLS